MNIGANIANALLRKIRADIQSAISINDAAGDDDDDTVHRLDPISASAMGIKSGDRHVRTRLYFTSESHLHSVMNVLRFTSQVSNEALKLKPIVCREELLQQYT